ncbi:MAG: TauD/TfdA family dioxygenase [Hyphomicrobiales bacterium]|nr:TauD/TfdA family dioxygenase [Hyphomicrobiales bacterium]
MRYADYAGAEQATAVLEQQLDGPWAWTRDQVTPSDCIVPLGDTGLKEVRSMAETIEANPLPAILRHPDQFEIPALRKVMARAKRRLTEAPGIAVIDRLPLDELEDDTAAAISWTLGQLISRPVAQKWDGTMLFDVTDTGATFGYGVRGSITTVELVFHTDNASGLMQPDYVGLLCRYPAKEGGVSRFCSLYSVHNRMLEKYPELLPRLYRPLLWDRQAEHGPDEPKVSRAPMFQWDGKRLISRANTNLNEKGYQIAGEEMDGETRAAIDAVNEVSTADELWFELAIERGQIQYLNNIEVAHYRSDFTDHENPEFKRHLVRTWHRDRGGPAFHG